MQVIRTRDREQVVDAAPRRRRPPPRNRSWVSRAVATELCRTDWSSLRRWSGP